jgi:hypothetical protein
MYITVAAFADVILDAVVAIVTAILMLGPAIAFFIAFGVFVYMFMVHPEPIELGSIIVSDTAKNVIVLVVALIAVTAGGALCYIVLNTLITVPVLAVHTLLHKTGEDDVVPASPAGV